MQNIWEKRKLKDIVIVTMGQSPKSEFYNSEGNGTPFLQGNRTFGSKYPYFDTFTTKCTKIAKEQDVIMSVRAPVGDLNMILNVVCLGRGVCSLRMNNDNQEFLYYLMKYNTQNLINRESGTVFGSINKRDIEEFEVSIPCNSIQNKISKILSSLDEKIEINRKINENLEEQAKEIFKYKFSNNDNYNMYRIGEYFDISIGKTPPRKEEQWFSKNESDIVWISIADMKSSSIYINKSSEYITNQAIIKHNIKIIPDNTVILSFKLTIGRVAITDGQVTTNEAIAHFKTDKKEITEYLYFYLKNFNYDTMGSTSSIASAINSKIIKSIPFMVPNEDDLLNFHRIVNPIFQQIKINQYEIQKLSLLRDELLPKLMTGEIDLSEIDI